MSITSEIQEYLRSAYLGGKTMQKCAEHYGMNDKKLRRALLMDGSHFNELKSAERKRRYFAMRDKCEAGVHMADALGFDDPPSFWRWHIDTFGKSWMESNGKPRRSQQLMKRRDATV